MAKYVNRENWFITHVIHEICQNLHVKRDQDTNPPPPPLLLLLLQVITKGSAYARGAQLQTTKKQRE